jgi:hypothetical protein
MSTRFAIRRDTTANWAAANPVLAAGEPAYDTQQRTLKIGDGSTHYNSLPVFADSSNLTVDMQKSDTGYLQYRVDGGAWTNILPLTDLKGDPGTAQQGNPGPAPVLITTSATTRGVVVGSRQLTMAVAADFQVGMYVTATRTSDPSVWMAGLVSAKSGTSLTIEVDAVAGTGTFSDWTIALSGKRGQIGPTGISGDVDYNLIGTRPKIFWVAGSGWASTRAAKLTAVNARQAANGYSNYTGFFDYDASNVPAGTSTKPTDWIIGDHWLRVGTG